MIRIDEMWLAVEPIDMRAGADRLLARVLLRPTTPTSSPIPAAPESNCSCTMALVCGVLRDV